MFRFYKQSTGEYTGEPNLEKAERILIECIKYNKGGEATLIVFLNCSINVKVIL